MFEKYTEKARRVVFFARYEASQFGSPYIETEHLLLGILREDKVLTNHFLRSHAAVETIRRQIEQHTTIREKVTASTDLPLSNANKRVLAYAAEEAERLSPQYIGTEHLLLGLLREEDGLAAKILHERGLKLTTVRAEIERQTYLKARQLSPQTARLTNFSKDLTQAAIEDTLDPIVGRESEIQWIIEVLSSRNNNNPVLIGARGAGKTAVVEGLARRIVDGEVPSFLAEKRLLAFDLQLVMGGTRDRQKIDERLGEIRKGLLDAPQIIMFVEEFQSLFGPGFPDAAEIFRPALLGGKIQCIGACTPEDYKKSLETLPWLGRCFRTVPVFAFDEAKSIAVLQAKKPQYEKFHDVEYTDEVLRLAVHYSRRFFPDSPLLAKATEVLDAAGSRVKLRQALPPDEISEVQKKIKFLVFKMEDAIANHQFEKARSYSDEERKERENLRTLRERYSLDDSITSAVGREDVEAVISRLTGLPIASITEEGDNGKLNAKERIIAIAAKKSSTVRVFLCHSSKDKPAIRSLYKKLKENQIDVWLDEEKLLPGQDWEYEIGNAVRASHVVIVCLSSHSVTQSGYVQKEIKKVLDVADEQPEGTIYVIPIKLEECEVPNRLRRWHWVNLFEASGFDKLIDALRARAQSLAE